MFVETFLQQSTIPNISPQSSCLRARAFEFYIRSPPALVFGQGLFFGEYINAGIYIKGDGKVKYTKTVTLDFDMIGRLEKLKEKREFDSFSSMLRAGLRKLLEEEGL